MSKLAKRFKRVDEVHPWLADASIYLGFNRTWSLDYYFGFTGERMENPDYLSLDPLGNHPVGIVVNRDRGEIQYSVFNLDDTDSMYATVILEIKSRIQMYGININYHD